MISGRSLSSSAEMRSFRTSLRFFSRWSLQVIGPRLALQRLDGAVEVPVLLPQSGKLVPDRRVADLDHPAVVVHVFGGLPGLKLARIIARAQARRNVVERFTQR